MRPPGFPFWGLFLTFGLFIALYLAWMLTVERRERRRQRKQHPPRTSGQAGLHDHEDDP